MLAKLGEAMGLPVTGDPTAFAGNSGAGEAEEEEVNEDESIVHQTASTGDVEVHILKTLISSITWQSSNRIVGY